MEALLEVLKFTLPGLIVFATAYFMLKTFMDNDQKKRIMEAKLNNQKLITPLRLQAYERMILFLERISPHQLVMRTFEPTYRVEHFQQALLATVRAEYEHNLSQQIYISGKTWNAVRITKENIVKIINQSAARLKKDAPAMELSRIMLETVMKLDKEPTSTALEMVKIEVGQYF
jgi:hypothetical protein